MARSTLVQLIIGAKDEASKVLGSVASGLTKVTAAAAATATAVAGYFGVNLFTGGIKSAADFESAMARIQAATGANATEMAALSKAAEDAGRKTVFSSGEAANALEILGKAGLGAQDSITTLPSLLALAEGQSLDLNTAAGLLTDTISQMGFSFADAATVADVLAKGANISNTSVQDLGASLSYAGAGAKNAGLSLQQTVAVLDVLAQSGLRGERAGTALQNILAQLSNPASQARVELAKLGATSSNLGEALDAIKNAGDKATPAINAFGLNAGPAIRALSDGGVAAVSQFATQLDNAGGSAQNASRTIADTLVGAVRSLGSSWDALSQFLTKPLLQPIADAARDLTGAINDSVASGKLDKLRESIVNTFNAGVKAVREFITSFNFDEATTKASDAVSGLSEKFNTLSGIGTKTADGLSAAWYIFKAGVDSLGGAITELLGAFVSLGTGAVKILAKVGLASQETVLGMENLKQSIGDAAAAYDQDLVNSLDKAGAAFGRLTGTAETTATAIGKSAPQADAATEAFNRQGKALEELGFKFDDTTQSFVASAQKTASATDQTAAAIQRQIEAVKAQAQAGTLSQTAAQAYIATLERQQAALGKTSAETQKLGNASNDSASQLDQLYQSLGLVNRAAEESKLDQEKAQLDALRDSGAVTAEEYYRLADAIRVQREALQSGGGDGGTKPVVKGNESISTSASDASDKTEQLNESLGKVPSIAAMVASKISAALGSIGALSKEAQAAAEAIRPATNSWVDWAAAVGKLDPQQFVSQDQALSGLNEQLKSFQAQAAAAAGQAKYLKEQAMFGPGIEWNTLSKGLADIYGFTEKLANAKARVAEFQISLYGISSAAKDGSDSLEEQYNKLTALKNQYRDLDKASLSALQTQIDQVSASLKSMSDAADQTLSSLQSQLAQAQGRLADQAAIDAQQKILDLQNKINEAKAAGNQKALADLQQALAVQDQLNRIAIANAKTQEQQAKTTATATTTTAASAAPTTTPIKTVRVDIGNGQGFDVPANQEDQVMALLKKLGAAKGVSTR